MLAANMRQSGSAATIRAAALGGLDRVLGRSGIRLASLCERVEVDPAHLRDPESRLPVSRFVELLELAAAQSKDDTLGLHLSFRQPLSALGEFRLDKAAGVTTDGSISECAAGADYAPVGPNDSNVRVSGNEGN